MQDLELVSHHLCPLCAARRDRAGGKACRFPAHPEPRLHPVDAIERARPRAWMQFGSSILADIWGLETARDPEIYATKHQALAGAISRL
jgi:hypothetical protein